MFSKKIKKNKRKKKRPKKKRKKEKKKERIKTKEILMRGKGQLLNQQFRNLIMELLG